LNKGEFVPTDDAEPLPPVSVPHGELPAETLDKLIESFVLREGTDYGEREVTLDTKVAQVRRQLDRGDIEIMFDPNTESVNIVVAKTGRRVL
jgi:hypothetical protein